MDADDRICIVGAGPSGLVTARVLLADGFDVDVYDKASSLGGSWHPDRTYPTLRTNDTREFYFGRCHAERYAGIGEER